jgi:hypothetical protein
MSANQRWAGVIKDSDMSVKVPSMLCLLGMPTTMKPFARLFLSVTVLCFGAIAHAGDADLLKSLDGNWSGKGTVKVRVNSLPMTVSCKFSADTTERSLSLNGNCTGFMGFSRAVGASLKLDGSAYTGTYIGGGTGPAGLNGKRAGNTLELGILWAKPVNGDRNAKMRIEKIGSDGMRLSTIDIDPKTGKSVVTSEINLRRG